MEAASVPAAPAAADANGQVQAPPAADPAQAAQPAAPQVPDAGAEGDIRSQLAAMEAKVAELTQAQAPAAPDPDLLTALQGGPDDVGFTPEELAALQAGQEPGQVDPAQQDAQLAELDSYVQERIQQALDPIVQERQIDAVKAFQKENPDVTDFLPEIEATIGNAVERYGDGARFDVNLLNMALTAARAQRADAAATPAEQAGANGASLETGAGQPQPGEDSEADQYRKLLTSGAGNPLA